MIRKNKAKEILKAGGAAIGTCISFIDPAVAEIIGRLGFDFFVLDNEHVSMDKSTVVNIMRSSEIMGVDIAPLIRIREGSAIEVLQAIDAGAMGIQVPGVDTYEKAKAVASAAYYPPKGARGFGSSQRAIGYGFMDRFEYFKTANEEILTVVQCESLESVSNLDKILEIDAIDVVFVGAMDLSCSMGPEIMGRRDHPELVSVFNDSVRKIVAAGKIAGGAAGGKAATEELCELGVRYISLGIDQAFLKSSAAESLRLCREIVKGHRQ
jgi:4-hydroxy-2-oxoheptanedioate aldolase